MTEAARFFAYLVGFTMAVFGVGAFIASCAALVAIPFIGSGSVAAAVLTAIGGAVCGTIGGCVVIGALK